MPIFDQSSATVHKFVKYQAWTVTLPDGVPTTGCIGGTGAPGPRLSMKPRARDGAGAAQAASR